MTLELASLSRLCSIPWTLPCYTIQGILADDMATDEKHGWVIFMLVAHFLGHWANEDIVELKFPAQIDFTW